MKDQPPKPPKTPAMIADDLDRRNRFFPDAEDEIGGGFVSAVDEQGERVPLTKPEPKAG